MTRTLTTQLTPEDHDVVAHLVLQRRGGFSWLCELLVDSYRCDKRDAELMYRLTKTGADTNEMIVMTNEPFRAVAHSLLACGMEPRLP